MSTHDVVIVGAGPAGSTLAYRLAQAGLDVALLEWKSMPRVKPCGGGIDGLFMKHLPEGIDLSGVIEAEADRTVVRFQGKEQGEFALPKPIYMTQRRFLDQRLASSASEVGARLIEGVRVNDVTRESDGGWRVDSTAGAFHAPLVVGADGAYSTVARSVGIPQYPDHRTTFIASEWDVVVAPAEQQKYAKTALIDCSLLPLGYGWIFPKGDHLNVGFGLPQKKAKTLKNVTRRFVEDRSGLSIIEHRDYSHWIPFAKVGAPVVKDGVLLVGDAAGVCDPTTGAGISWAVHSSALAAPCVLEAVRGNTFDSLTVYQQSIYNLQKEVELGMALRNLLILSFLARRRLWVSVFQWILQCLSGQAQYSQWANAHPWQRLTGMGVQKLVVERLI